MDLWAVARDSNIGGNIAVRGGVNRYCWLLAEVGGGLRILDKDNAGG